MQQQGCEAAIKEVCDPDPNCSDNRPTVCFEKPELFDVINASTGAKIAGAAQKRSKRGLLFQGSIWRPTVGEIDWMEFETTFVEKIAELLREDANETPWPDSWDESIDALAESYASEEWIERR